jgi:hypothetical protein
MSQPTVSSSSGQPSATDQVAGAQAQMTSSQQTIAQAENEAGGSVAAVIAAPLATDGSGGSVPTSLSVSGNIITLTIPHSAASVYPIDAEQLTVVRSWTDATDKVDSQGNQQSPGPSPRDTDPDTTNVNGVAEALSPATYGGFFVDGTVDYVGYARDQGPSLARLRARFPGVTIRAYATPRSAQTLDGISHSIESAMNANTASATLYAVPNYVTGTVDVGVTDTNASDAQSWATQYGAAIRLIKDVPLDISDPVAQAASAPGYNDTMQPMQAGAFIYSDHYGPNGDKWNNCTAGVMYRGPAQIENGRIVPSPVRGIVTAGHCLYHEPLTLNWNQGTAIVGFYATHRFVTGSHCDCGTIVTNNGVYSDRDVSPKVFRGTGIPSLEFTDITPKNWARRGQSLETSTSQNGLIYGEIHTGGSGHVYEAEDPATHERIRIYNVESADLKRPVSSADSGSPIYVTFHDQQGDKLASALGVVFARATHNHRHVIFSQSQWIQDELNVTICTSTDRTQC